MVGKVRSSRMRTDTGNGGAGDGGSDDAGFDRFIERQLHRMYDKVMEEPLPAEIAELLAQLPTRAGTGGEPEQG
jgi:hypothetical protein